MLDPSLTACDPKRKSSGEICYHAARLDSGRVFIAGEQPLSVDQVRQKLVLDGWSNIQVSQKGRFIAAVATRNGEEKAIEVEALTGRLRTWR